MIKILVLVWLCISLSTYAHTSKTLKTSNSEQSIYKWNKLVFKSDLHVNLHHFLAELARDEQYYKNIIGSENLTPQESQVLAQSVALYKNEMGSGHILFGRGTVPQMTGSVLSRKLIDFDTPISQALLLFKPIYERVYWSKHHQQNKLWVTRIGSQN